MKRDKVPLLLRRLQQIAHMLKQHPQGLGLLGLGSTGDQSRMDEYSDLDFFAVVAEDHKYAFIDDLSWLANIAPVAYAFRNTQDGYKLLYGDGVFCEFAVFEAKELQSIPYQSGQFIWRDDSLPESLATPCLSTPEISQDVPFLLGELLTNLYVGLCRYQRGEMCSAQRFVQVYAMDRLISLLDLTLTETDLQKRDPFCIDRRAEQRHRQVAQHLSGFLSDAARLPETVVNMLDFVKQRFPVDSAMEANIRELL
ncbi:hypothetical protein [Planctobacterium marinum]|uniref:Uncharacterized protein n=1 Tax=Planctobacterium marinum TaxID=1631968 RepID=A0AA48HHJ3_9ALTE|nr:hypothetical protein MACH26_03020 [Planctobacterium marinum]